MDAIEKKKYLIDKLIKPTLKDKGFKKVSNNFIKTDSLDTKIISINSDRWNTKESVRFGFSIGFYNEVVLDFFLPNRKVIKPERIDWILNFNMYDLLPNKDKNYYQYHIDSNNEIDGLITTITNDLEQILLILSDLNLPLDYFKLIKFSPNQKQVIEIYSLILLIREGDIKNAELLFKNLYDNFDGHEKVKEQLKSLGLNNKLII